MMPTILKNREILNSFADEIEKNAISMGGIVSRINPFRRFGKKVVKEVAKPSRWKTVGKELAAIPVVAGGVVLAGGLYGAATLPPAI